MLILKDLGLMSEMAFIVTMLTAVMLIGNFELPEDLVSTSEVQTVIRTVVGLSLLYTGFNTFNVTYECSLN